MDPRIMERGFTAPEVMTRAAGLERLAGFVAGAGVDYAARRNDDRGAGAEPTTSALSPYLRRRLITEAEVAAAARGAYGERGADKFVSEVFWRTYFKGHLETHPGAWTGYLGLAEADRAGLDAAPGLRRTYEAAIAGCTGIDAFDAWAAELTGTGWLHNHARMWFASVWIFTLRLPWALGAAHFMAHLVDGDPASNTLSWRWVAGLHTRGKHYVARAENIRRHTEDRFDPAGLDEHPAALDEERPPREVPLPAADAAPAGEVALLVHLDDLHPESLPLGAAHVARVGGMTVHAPGATDRVRAADRAAMADALARAAEHFGCPAGPIDGGAAGGTGGDWAGGLPVVAAWAPVGPSADALPTGCLRVRRAWDEAAWPLSTRGYSRLRKAIPTVLDHDAANGGA